MLKRVLFLIVLFTTIDNIIAQDILYPSCPLNKHINDKVLYGIKGGINLPRLYYSDMNLKKLPHDFVLEPTASVFVEFKVYNNFSMAIELNYQQRGGKTSYVYETDYNVTYQLQAKYVSLRFPFYWYWSDNYRLSPYLFFGPDFGYVIGGNISLSQQGLPIEEVSVQINDANMNKMYIGLLGGIGIRKNAYLRKWLMVFKVDVALNWGLLNTFAYSEIDDTATSTNVHAYNKQGRRSSIGFEINLSFALRRDYVDVVCYPF